MCRSVTAEVSTWPLDRGNEIMQDEDHIRGLLHTKYVSVCVCVCVLACACVCLLFS
jgi:hypothetical protein